MTSPEPLNRQDFRGSVRHSTDTGRVAVASLPKKIITFRIIIFNIIFLTLIFSTSVNKIFVYASLKLYFPFWGILHDSFEHGSFQNQAMPR